MLETLYAIMLIMIGIPMNIFMDLIELISRGELIQLLIRWLTWGWG